MTVRTQRAANRSEGLPPALAPLTAANAALYLGASTLHTGLRLPLGFATLGFPQAIPQASVAEGLIGIALAAAAGAALTGGRSARSVAWAAYGFALAGTLLGLTIVLLRRLGGPDLGVHFVMLAGLVCGLLLLFTTRSPRDELAHA